MVAMNKRDTSSDIMRLANIIYFRSGAYNRTEWMGTKTAKCPMDMWVYQELLFATKTDLLIETGTLFGGSALFFAQMFQLMGRGKVISIDIDPQQNLPAHPRIQYVTGSSLSDDVIRVVEEASVEACSVMVVLDSDHRTDHKLRELELYSTFVTVGNFLIAEDTCFDHYPAWPEFGPGPALAVERFMKENVDFEIDRSPERHLITFAPRAFLRRRRA